MGSENAACMIILPRIAALEQAILKTMYFLMFKQFASTGKCRILLENADSVNDVPKQDDSQTD